VATGTGMMQYAHMKLTAELPWQKQQSTKDSFHQQTELNLRDKLVKCYIWNIAFMMLKLGHFRHTRKVFGMWCWKMEISLTTV
jgi:hypothetical protein